LTRHIAKRASRVIEKMACCAQDNKIEMISISIRLQRITTEVAWVSVPVTPDLVLPDRAGPSVFSLNAEKR